MKTLIYALLASGVLFSNSSNATPCLAVPQMSPVGTSCETSKLVTFIRVDRGWKDTGLNGKIWYDMVKLDDQPRESVDALLFCKSYGLKVPTGWPSNLNGQGFPNSDSDVVTAENHGILEVLKDTFNGKHTWWQTASFIPSSSNLQYCFREWSPGLLIDYKDIDHHNEVAKSAICIDQ